MPSRLKALIQYVVILLVTVFLIWFSLRGITPQEGENKWDYILGAWQLADKRWLVVMAVFAILSHIVRAMRWKMLIDQTGHPVKLANSFLSLMVGYLVNLVIPRGGEVSRCYNLYKLDQAPVEVSFGTVVVERVVDLICLLLLISLAFILESRRLFSFVETLSLDFSAEGGRVLFLLLLAGGLALVVAVGYWLVRRSPKLSGFFAKTWKGMKSGLLSVFRLKNKGLFIFQSALIWVLYFFMSYAVIKAFQTTSHLGFNAVISLFGIGSIAMAAPLPGGTGAYHVLVPQGLSFLYGLELKDAVALTFVFHGWQTFIMIVGGALSLIITSIIPKKR
ncbi:MAG TPA: lysylphosphatidylglycerol synthase transmembrane domain-containing protein [Cyclobacteriaceae bacterium]|nr:lysylphosphatidylglycerol synthase transmembrane domain-containing protein [Cyclobacteriaceae bacterium]